MMAVDIEKLDLTTPAYLDLVDQVADQFRAVILEWLGADICQKVDEDNQTLGPLACATQDHCDANMAMDKAMRDIGVYGEDLEGAFTDRVTDLWNTSWSLAVQKGFAPNA